MSEKMYPIPFRSLMNWILAEREKTGDVFDVHKRWIADPAKTFPIFGEKIESPFGPAAGPNSQLAQNIIAAYMAGARFFEVKTVQKMDGAELAACVPRPCILAADEGYNQEWSTELEIPQARDEYIKAWCALKVLSKVYGFGDPDGFVFNMSVGYDLEGIKGEKVNTYIDNMMDASETKQFKECLEVLAELFPTEKDYIASISPRVSRSVTVSTLHGCPPQEIERIASYLLTEKHLHTFVKCNPTILGYKTARTILDSMGYDYIAFDEHHFNEDLQWVDAVPMFERLQALADSKGLEFGLKLSNTFPVDTTRNELPGTEMYMSGRSLFPLTIEMCNRISRQFNGKMRISFAGGAEFFNCDKLFAAGIWPITVATTILKPGGYNRLHQMVEKTEKLPYKAFCGTDSSAISDMSTASHSDFHHLKPIKPVASRKSEEKVPWIDCFTAPCKGGCPIHQDIPEYIELCRKGLYGPALKLITEKNALPFITGTICSHRCQDKCMRNAYDESVYIRAQKLKAAEGGFEALLPKLHPAAPAAGRRVAVVGGGPGGMSAAYFLGRSGVDVTVFERRDALGGIVRHVIPGFRIPGEAIDNDVRLMEAMGVKVELNTEVKDVQELFAQGFTHVILATGAWQKGSAGLEYGEEHNVIEFLEAAKKAPDTLNLGRHVVVIGGGNTAMDAARAAKRLPGVETVSLVYRRTRRYMPADQEELELALADGVEFRELLAPVGVRDGVLTCRVMELGAPDATGRRSPVDTGRTAEVPADTVITAVGEKVDTELYTANGLSVDQRGRAVVNPDTLESSVKHVFVVGDGQKGPGTVVEAIAGAARAAQAIHPFDADAWVEQNVNPDYQKPLAKRGDVCTDCASCEDSRCLGCATVCETCTEVCPNRANVAVWVPGMRQRQIIHVDGMCNECGNCATFCPYDSRPYQDKFTLFWSADDFENSRNEGFLRLEDVRTRVRLGGQVADYDVSDAACGLYDPLRRLICAVYENYAYLLG